MDKIVTENLFLLEFLVDSVNLDQCVCQEIGDVAGDTCVSVQFLDNPPLNICEDDFAPKRNYASDSNNVKSGKSCLFSLTPAQAEEGTYQFDVYVSVFKKMKPGVMPEKVQIGTSLISIVNLFNELLASINIPTNESSPTAKTIKDVFQINDSAGQAIGDIGMYIRMSCFGKLIVTQFQMNLDDKSVLFKDREGHSLYRYKKAAKRNSELGNKGRGPCGVNTNVPEPQLPKVPPPSPMDYNGQCGCPQEGSINNITENDNSRYHEIGAAMGANALTIRVHKENKLEQLDTEDNSCTCTSTYQPNKAPRASGGGCVQNEQSFSMRPACDNGGNGNAPFSLKVGTRGNLNPCFPQNGNVTVVPPVTTGPDGTQYTELSDPNKDVFILRIGKKSEGSEKKKNNLELELCTPKGPDIKPPARKETRDSQWDDADALEAGGGSGGKKGGKKGKDKGKKKK